MNLTSNFKSILSLIPRIQFVILGVSTAIFIFGSITQNSIEASTQKQQKALIREVNSLEEEKSKLAQQLETKRKLNKLYSATSKNNYSVAYTYYVTKRLPKHNVSKILAKLDRHCRTPLFATKRSNLIQILPSDLAVTFTSDRLIDRFLVSSADYYCK